MSRYTTNFKNLVDGGFVPRDEIENIFKSYNMLDYLTPEEIEVINTRGTWTPDKLAKKIVDHYYLKDLGFESVYVVEEQAIPDGNFPTCPSPNPENAAAFELALKLAKEKDADIVLATDPDADRLGVYCKDTKTGEWVSFTGNMSGMLIAEYIMAEKTATLLPTEKA